MKTNTRPLKITKPATVITGLWVLNLILILFFFFSKTGRAQAPDISKYKNSSSGFFENKGQILDQFYKPNPGVKYLFTSPGLNIQLRQTGFSYDTYTDEETVNSRSEEDNMAALKGKEISKSFTRHYHRVDIELKGCNTNTQLIAENKSSAYYNYLTSTMPDGGVSYVHYYQQVTYKNIYPNIDLVFTAAPSQTFSVQSPFRGLGRKESFNRGAFEYFFVVHPGGNPANIKLEYKGANKVNLAGNKLVINVAAGDFTENIPGSYWRNTKEPVQVNYASLGNNVYGFLIPDFQITNLQSDLIIDPVPALAWGTYYGGTGIEYASGITLDGGGNAYIAGYTNSTNNIATAGAYQTSLAGNNDAFIAKFNSSGTNLIWGTYYGGTGDDAANCIALDGSGNVCIGGYTTSASGIATPFGWLTTYLGTQPVGFVAVISSAGSSLLCGTYYGAFRNTRVSGITVEPLNNAVFVTGTTTATSYIAHFGYLNVFQGISDVFVAKFMASLSLLSWGTYYGGSDDDEGYGIAIDASDNVYITGITYSGNGISTPGVYEYFPPRPAFPPQGWAFAAEFDPFGSTLLWGTYFGGRDGTGSKAIALDANNNVYITGSTQDSAYIATPGAYDTVQGGSWDAYIAKFNSTGTNLLWGTYYGGTGNDGGMAIALDESNNVFITGYTDSPNGIATPGAYDTALAGINGFVAKFDSAGSAIDWGTYYGGPGNANIWGIALDASGNVYVTGNASSATGIATPGAFDTILSGGEDAFVAKFGPGAPLPITLLSFTAKCNNNVVLLSWSTATEVNNDHFIIQRTIDGINWQLAGTVKGAGNSTSTKYYTFNDVFAETNEPVYYRLGQVDYDGATNYFNSITTNCAEAPDNWIVFPNPTTGKVAISFARGMIAGIQDITLYDVFGHCIFNECFSSLQGLLKNDTLDIDLSEYSKGTYFITLQTSAGPLTRMLVLQ